MSILVIVEHNNNELLPATLHTVNAAKQIGNTDALVIGNLTPLRAAQRTNVAQRAWPAQLRGGAWGSGLPPPAGPAQKGAPLPHRCQKH